MTESLGKWGFPCGSAGRVSFFNAGDLGSIPGLGRSPGEGKLENSMDCVVHGIAKSQTPMNNFHFHLMWFIIKALTQIIETVTVQEN